MESKHYISEEAKKALDWTQKIIDDCGSRITGDPSTIKSAELIKTQFESYADRVDFEKFNVYPKSFLGWIRIFVIFYLISVVAYWIQIPIIAAILISIGFIFMIFQFFLYKPLLDHLFPKRTGINVIGTIEPKKEVKQQIIVSGHHD